MGRNDKGSHTGRYRTIAAGFGVLTLAAGFGIPAQAAPGAAAPTGSSLADAAQSVRIIAGAAPPGVPEDQYVVVTGAEIRAAQEAARRAAEEAARAEAAARAAAEAAASPARGGSDAPAGGGAAFAPAPPAGTDGAAIIAYAQQFVGVVPYGTGNTPAQGFSCDGFVQYVFAAFGRSLPRGADSQGSLGTRISQSEAVAGDLMWWPGQHVAIYDGAGGMLDSPDWGRMVQHRSGWWGSPVFVRL